MTSLSNDYPADNHDAIALWDLDGTLADYDPAMEEWLNKLRSPQETWTGRGHNVNEEWMRERIKLVRRLPGFWRDLRPLNLGFELIEAAKPFNFENHVLTKSPKAAFNAFTEKAEWCNYYVPDFHVTIGGKKQLVYGKVLFDDWPGYILPWLEVRPRGLAIAVAQPWNEGLTHPNLVRYDGTNLNEVVDRLAAARASVKTPPPGCIRGE